jgi:site-specific DNA-cytosine methylase
MMQAHQTAVGFNWQNGGGYGEANDGLGITLEGVGPLQRCQTPAVANGGGMAVRRLTPKECERLQGFPDNHTLIPWRGKPAEQCPDGPRYKALGNSMAVPCMAWIGSRIAAQDSEPLRYLSVCSGIEAASMAWEPLGWQPAAFAEVEKFPSAVLTHHWPQVPNMGDMNNHEQWDLPSIDVLVGGTPCQSFSVAGLRKGLRDPRGGLMLTFLEIAQRRRPRWVVWENVPGVLSSHGGRDFGAFLGALGALGYGWAYRVLDAQWFGVAQRRRRVFVIANLGDGAAPAKVLFESESVRRNPAPSREAGERTAAFTPSSIGSYRAGYGTLRANGGDNGGGSEVLVTAETVGALTDGAHQGGANLVPSISMRESGQGYWMQDEVAGSLRAEGENRPSRPSNVIASGLPDVVGTLSDGDCLRKGAN